MNVDKEIYTAVYKATAIWMRSKGFLPHNYIEVDSESGLHDIFYITADVPDHLLEVVDDYENWEEFALDLKEFFFHYNAISPYKFNLYDFALYECPDCGALTVEVVLYC